MEPIPPNALLIKGEEVNLYMFIGGDHAGNVQTKRFKSGFMIYK